MELKFQLAPLCVSVFALASLGAEHRPISRRHHPPGDPLSLRGRSLSCRSNVSGCHAAPSHIAIFLASYPAPALKVLTLGHRLYDGRVRVEARLTGGAPQRVRGPQSIIYHVAACPLSRV